MSSEAASSRMPLLHRVWTVAAIDALGFGMGTLYAFGLWRSGLFLVAVLGTAAWMLSLRGRGRAAIRRSVIALQCAALVASLFAWSVGGPSWATFFMTPAVAVFFVLSGWGIQALGGRVQSQTETLLVRVGACVIAVALVVVGLLLSRASLVYASFLLVALAVVVGWQIAGRAARLGGAANSDRST